MKRFYIPLAVGLVAGVGGVIAALALFTNKGPTPNPVAAAEPAKADAGGYSSQYESTKPRTVIDKLVGRYQGSLTNYASTGGEYDLMCYASRTRSSGREVYRVGIGQQFTKINGVKEKAEADYREISAEDAVSAVRFIDRMKGAKKSADPVDYAVIRWTATVYLWNGEQHVGESVDLTCKYDGVKFTSLPNNFVPTVHSWCKEDTAHLAKLLAEGLKDVEALKKAEWSPTP